MLTLEAQRSHEPVPATLGGSGWSVISVLYCWHWGAVPGQKAIRYPPCLHARCLLGVRHGWELGMVTER